MWLRRMSKRRLVRDILGGEQRRFEGVHVVGDLAEVDDVPVVGPEALGDVVAVRQLGVAVDRDVVVVVDADQLAEPEVPGERAGLVRHAFHEATVTGDHVGVVIDGLRPKRAASTRSAIAMPTALAKPCPSGPVVTSMPGV